MSRFRFVWLDGIKWDEFVAEFGIDEDAFPQTFVWDAKNQLFYFEDGLRVRQFDLIGWEEGGSVIFGLMRNVVVVFFFVFLLCCFLEGGCGRSLFNLKPKRHHALPWQTHDAIVDFLDRVEAGEVCFIPCCPTASAYDCLATDTQFSSCPK